MAFLKTKHLQELKLADYITILGLNSAIFSIFFSLSGQFFLAFFLIFLQLFFDILDGKIARKFGGSTLGLFLDSFADYTSIIATGIFVYNITNGGIIFFISFSLYTIFSAIRLSYFTYRFQNNETDFIGVPTTFTTVFLSILFLINYYFHFLNNLWTPILFLFFGYLMISDLKIKKIKL